tara:strand:+ start:256 stop:1455 length:1200 start_codon:yes stop_codon:yes gene_type:complete
MGPTLIFDKSAIHSFAEREATWLTNLYNINCTPTLFMEIMADLKKKPSDCELSAAHVQRLAKKFSPINTYQNIHHEESWYHNLLGEHVPMDGRVMLGGGKEVTSNDGEKGMLFEESPEDKAMRRWKEGRFNDFEEALADRWRAAIKEIDLTKLNQVYSKSKGQKTFASLDHLAIAVNRMCDGADGQYRLLKNVIEGLVPGDDKFAKSVVFRWKFRGKPPIRKYAPYAVYCYAINTFFAVGLMMDMLSTKASNVIDLQYLYYLPFCHVFTSGDKFHKQVAPLFMQQNQLFVDPAKLKADLKMIADKWDQTDKDSGTAFFIKYPWRGENMVSEAIWDKCVPNWREYADQPEPEPRTPEENTKLMAKLRPMMDAIEKAGRKPEDGPINEWDAKLNPNPEDHR